MVRQEIVEGLKTALHKGESLKEAMMSFYNAGYSKKDIEEAARNLHSQTDIIPKEHQVQHASPDKEKPKKSFKPLPPPPSLIKIRERSDIPLEEKSPKPSFPPSSKHLIEETSAVSNYDANKPKSHKLLIITLILVGVIILGFVSGFFLFKEQLSGFFNNLFG